MPVSIGPKGRGGRLGRRSRRASRARLMGRAAFGLALLAGLSALGLAFFTEAAAQPGKPSNRLAGERSPYLRQHAANPIHWYPWGAEAFAAARREDKPVFLSIGYSSCHWCHVMSAESFADAEVAALMNAHFIAILVDREERPDVDRAYAAAVEAMIGTAGWPMNLFLTPEGRPFMGAAFIPKRRLLRLLTQFRDIWAHERSRIEAIGQQVAEALQGQAAAGFSGAPLPDEGVLRRFFAFAAAEFDAEHGGFGTGVKFLRPLRLSLLLRIHQRTGSSEALSMVERTLGAMARGGVYDHVGGGFHRYAVDREWRVPHFEKLLGDNALLASTYLEARRATGRAEYGAVARGILDYLLRDMTHPQGAFYAAEDADTDRTEGKFYVWTVEELRAALSAEEFARISESYAVTEAGNFNPWLKDVEEAAEFRVVHRSNILRLNPGRGPPGDDPVLRRALEKLLRVRAGRTRPLRDEKILAAWNGLAISAMSQGYRTLGDPSYLAAAQRAARFVLANLRGGDGRLRRRWIAGDLGGPGYLDDYAYLIQGLLNLYQSDFDPRWLEAALSLQRLQQRLFWQEAKGAYRFAEQADPLLPVGAEQATGGGLPSASGVAALNLLQLADLTLERSLRARSARAIATALASGNPAADPQMLMALDYLLDRSKEVAVIGAAAAAETRAFVGYLHRTYFPNKVVALGAPTAAGEVAEARVALLAGKPLLHGKPTVYVCENNICRLPTNDLDTVRGLMGEQREYALTD